MLKLNKRLHQSKIFNFKEPMSSILNKKKKYNRLLTLSASGDNFQIMKKS